MTRQHVHLSWEAPDHDGGSPLTGYQVEKRDVSRKTWVKVCDPCSRVFLIQLKFTFTTFTVVKLKYFLAPSQVVTGIQDQEFTVTDVIEGKEYVFKVSACNKCGPGEPAYIDEPVNISSPASELQQRHLQSMAVRNYSYCFVVVYISVDLYQN